MRLLPLFSGSSGNSTYIEISDTEGILIDAGKSAKQIEKMLSDNNISVSNIKALFVTHEHSDHILGLRVFAQRYSIKIYSSAGTINALKHKEVLGHKISYEAITKKGIDLGFASVCPFSVSHDCTEGVGYVITAVSGEKTALCTDLGYISDEVLKAITGCTTVMLESNHDVMMLQNGPYPYYLKKRILSDNGHLSNEACASILPSMINSGTKNIILSHLSFHNNLPELAYQTALCGLEPHDIKNERDFNLFVAPRFNDQGLSVLF